MLKLYSSLTCRRTKTSHKTVIKWGHGKGDLPHVYTVDSFVFVDVMFHGFGLVH